MGKGGGSDSISPSEVADLTRQQQRMSNPNVSNQFGSTTTQFNDNDQASITQSMSPDMLGLYNQALTKVQGGANVYKPKGASYNTDMRDRYNQRSGNRSGFQMPQREIPQMGTPQGMGQPPELPQAPNPMIQPQSAPPQGLPPGLPPQGAGQSPMGNNEGLDSLRRALAALGGR